MRSDSRLRFLRSKLALILLLVVVVFVVSSVFDEYQRRQAVAEEIRAIKEENARMELQRQRLTDLLEHAESPEFLEREARLRLGLQLPGEEVLVVPEGGVKGVEGIEGVKGIEAEGQAESNARRWWRAIFE